MPGGERADAATARADKPPTIYDVAKLAGVSHQTVSRFLKGNSGIKQGNRERVLQALTELGYRPNLAARTLATRRAHRVAVLVQAIDQHGPARILQGVILEARSAGYLLDIVTVDPDDPASVTDALQTVGRQHIAGVVALASSDEMTAALSASDFPVPVVAHSETDDTQDPVGSRGHQETLRAAVEHLIALGHRRFFHLGGPTSWVAARNRELAYAEALRRHGIASLGEAHGDWSAASGFALTTAIPRELGVTALVCANDQMAIGAMHALGEHGVRVPDDVSVTGVDDIPEAAFVQPPLTTLRLSFEQQGRRAFRNLLGQLSDSPELPPEPGAELVIRKSTGPAPRS